MIQPTLIGNQDDHADKVFTTLSSFKRVIDYSPTGSGKTYIAAHAVYKLLTQGLIQHVHIICPPSLKFNWKSVFEQFELPITLIHGYGLSNFTPLDNSIVICDEFHYLKNKSQRYDRMVRLFNETDYIICLSATPVDRSIQYSHYRRLLGVDCRSVRVKCEYTNSTEQQIVYSTDSEKDEGLILLYQKGYRAILACGKRAFAENNFKGALYTSGLYRIHESIVKSMIGLVEKELQEPNRKVIVIEQYTVYVKQLVSALGAYEPLLLNGKTGDRQKVIDLFQTPSTKNRLLITSASIGGVGLSLDDQDGGYPRTTIISPLGNFCEFKQVLGRTHRRNTKSNSRVIIAQPHASIENTYMKNMLSRKGAVFNAFFTKTDDAVSTETDDAVSTETDDTPQD